MSDPIVYAQQIRVPYQYTAGAASAAFLRALQDQRILGSRASDGRVLVPARPFADDGSRTGELVEVEPTGELLAWTTTHREGVDRSFGLVQLDGADTPMFHVLDVPPDELEAGLRLRARWAEESEPEITAIAAFELADAPR